MEFGHWLLDVMKWIYHQSKTCIKINRRLSEWFNKQVAGRRCVLPSSLLKIFMKKFKRDNPGDVRGMMVRK